MQDSRSGFLSPPPTPSSPFQELILIVRGSANYCCGQMNTWIFLMFADFRTLKLCKWLTVCPKSKLAQCTCGKWYVCIATEVWTFRTFYLINTPGVAASYCFIVAIFVTASCGHFASVCVTQVLMPSLCEASTELPGHLSTFGTKNAWPGKDIVCPEFVQILQWPSDSNAIPGCGGSGCS